MEYDKKTFADHLAMYYIGSSLVVCASFCNAFFRLINIKIFK